MIVKSGQDAFRIMNGQSQYNKLKERFHKSCLPYLNIQVKMPDGMASVKWYRKRSSNYILLHASSAHSSVKRAIVKNMVKIAADVCSGEGERQESL